MILIIDNYDSFTYNLYQYFEELGEKCLVVRNDKINIQEIENLNPKAIVISPGPGKPEESGISIDIVKEFAGKKPILGICLGHQIIGQVFGAKVNRLKNVCHGKSSKIYHNQENIYKNMKSPINVIRYHSLIVENIPECLEITSKTSNGLVMSLQHKDYPITGIQYHPESFMTENGKELIDNFLNVYVRN